MPSQMSSDQYQRLVSCTIEERIYGLLYSSASIRKTQQQREEAIVELDADLDKFEGLQAQADPKDSMSGWRGRPFLQLEMKFIHHQLRVMVLRCSTKPENKQRCLAEARRSIATLSNIRVAKTTIGGSMVLRR